MQKEEEENVQQLSSDEVQVELIQGRLTFKISYLF